MNLRNGRAGLVDPERPEWESRAWIGGRLGRLVRGIPGYVNPECQPSGMPAGSPWRPDPASAIERS